MKLDLDFDLDFKLTSRSNFSEFRSDLNLIFLSLDPNYIL